MKFKAPKKVVRQTVIDSVYRSVHLDISSMTYQQTGNVSEYLRNQVQFCIQNALVQVFDELLDQIYTDEEFEVDIGLKEQ